MKHKILLYIKLFFEGALRFSLLLIYFRIRLWMLLIISVINPSLAYFGKSKRTVWQSPDLAILYFRSPFPCREKFNSPPVVRYCCSGQKSGWKSPDSWGCFIFLVGFWEFAKPSERHKVREGLGVVVADGRWFFIPHIFALNSPNSSSPPSPKYLYEGYATALFSAAPHNFHPSWVYKIKMTFMCLPCI